MFYQSALGNVKFLYYVNYTGILFGTFNLLRWEVIEVSHLFITVILRECFKFKVSQFFPYIF